MVLCVGKTCAAAGVICGAVVGQEAAVQLGVAQVVVCAAAAEIERLAGPWVDRQLELGLGLLALCFPLWTWPRVLAAAWASVAAAKVRQIILAREH